MTNTNTNLHTNADIRCGLIMKVQINTCYVEHLFNEWKEDSYGELKYIRGSDTMGDETSHTTNFWDDFSNKYCNMFEKWSKEEHDDELCYLFQEHLEDWNDYFSWYEYVEDESSEEEEEE